MSLIGGAVTNLISLSSTTYLLTTPPVKRILLIEGFTRGVPGWGRTQAYERVVCMSKIVRIMSRGCGLDTILTYTTIHYTTLNYK